MKRLFWLSVGMVMGAWGYRYFREQGGQIPGMEDLGERGRRLTERGRTFAESGRQLAEESRQFAQAAKDTAQSAVGTAQERGRDMVEKVRSRTGMTDDGNEPMREDIQQAAGEASG